MMLSENGSPYRSRIFPDQVFSDDSPWRLQFTKSCNISLFLTPSPHVSRAWRAAALGTSVLWSRLEVDVSSSDFSWGQTEDYANGHPASSWRWRSALNQFLVLAQNFPLRISLTFSGMSRWRTDEEIQDILSAFFHTAPRWRSLCLVFHDTGDLSFLDPLHGRLDSLETLTVIVFKCYGFPPTRCTAFRDAPKLTKAFITPKNTMLVELPWSRLLDADFTVDGGGDKALMVHHVLVVCQESYGYFDVPVLDQPIIVELPRLEKITLFASSQLGHWLVLPSLSKLRVFESQPDSRDDPVPSPHLIQSLVARAKCNIISLTISNVTIASRTLDGLRHIADHFPQLVSFRFEQDLRDDAIVYVPPSRRVRFDVSMGVFSFLTRTPTTDSPFSLLENVTLLTHVDSSLDPDDVFRIFPSLSVMLALRARPDSAAARVWTHARIYRPTTKTKDVRNGVQGRYHRFSKVEDDTRWQTLTGEYRGQINVLIEVIETAMYDYQIWLGRTPEPEGVWE
ncbi:hypothetical protein BDZ89DRAFT_1139265 [Hymenopellis radicata]|nr:hypothetical protein BDZ89DRAFT_1139265 [Hymenopellis radicata]